eukprot:1552436-Pyramimonas_sp.AAC.1
MRLLVSTGSGAFSGGSSAAGRLSGDGPTEAAGDVGMGGGFACGVDGQLMVAAAGLLRIAAA